MLVSLLNPVERTIQLCCQAPHKGKCCHCGALHDFPASCDDRCLEEKHVREIDHGNALGSVLW